MPASTGSRGCGRHPQDLRGLQRAPLPHVEPGKRVLQTPLRLGVLHQLGRSNFECRSVAGEIQLMFLSMRTIRAAGAVSLTALAALEDLTSLFTTAQHCHVLPALEPPNVDKIKGLDTILAPLLRTRDETDNILTRCERHTAAVPRRFIQLSLQVPTEERRMLEEHYNSMVSDLALVVERQKQQVATCETSIRNSTARFRRYCT